MGSHFDKNSTKSVSDSDPVGPLLGDLLGDRLVIDWVIFCCWWPVGNFPGDLFGGRLVIC